ncbi:MAG: hypothetical protein ACI9WU_003052, partial [Myxococcota bacterium]
MAVIGPHVLGQAVVKQKRHRTQLQSVAGLEQDL